MTHPKYISHAFLTHAALLVCRSVLSMSQTHTCSTDTCGMLLPCKHTREQHTIHTRPESAAKRACHTYLSPAVLTETDSRCQPFVQCICSDSNASPCLSFPPVPLSPLASLGYYINYLTKTSLSLSSPPPFPILLLLQSGKLASLPPSFLFFTSPLLLLLEMLISQQYSIPAFLCHASLLPTCFSPLTHPLLPL